MIRTRAWARTWTALRAAMGLLILAAIVTQAVRTIQIAVENGRDVAMTLANFFSYFTILANVGSVFVLLWAAVWFWMRGRDRVWEPRGIGLALASVTTYMIVTGVVYNVLLRDVVLAPGTTVWWTNEVLHVVGPLFLLLDLFLGPRRRCLGWGAIAVGLGVVAAGVVWVSRRRGNVP